MDDSQALPSSAPGFWDWLETQGSRQKISLVPRINLSSPRDFMFSLFHETFLKPAALSFLLQPHLPQKASPQHREIRALLPKNPSVSHCCCCACRARLSLRILGLLGFMCVMPINTRHISNPSANKNKPNAIFQNPTFLEAQY